LEGKDDYEGHEWVYPDCVGYRPSTIRRFGENVGLFVTRIPWYHPRQTWYLFANQIGRLPTNAMMHLLSGAVLFDPEFAESRQARRPIARITRKYVGQPIKRGLQRLQTRKI
jgi:hypothetical protein